ncbi:MAG: N-acetylneuraminate synthase family protein [Bacteroidota bacterium]
MELNSSVTIGGLIIGHDHRPFIIAEMACAHNGDLQQAIQLVDAAVEAGADAVQLQFFKADETVTPNHPAFEVVKRIEFSEDKWKTVFQYAKSKNILVFVCTYDIPSVALAVQLGADGIKLNSADLSNPEVVMSVAKSGIPFTLGTGASTLEEIKSGLDCATSSGAANIILMHGVQNFPTRTEDLNINRIRLLKEHFNMPVGYHDHTDGEDDFSRSVDLIAIGMGANVIEKHITLSRAEKGIDYQAALEPGEFKKFVQQIHRAWIAMGKKEIGPFSESDLKYRAFQKKSIVAAEDIQPGEKILRASVKFIRNEVPGIPPSRFHEVENKTAKFLIRKFENITNEKLE